MNAVVDAAATLAAGGIVPGPAGGTGADAMLARAYRHHVLDERVVVRLHAATIGEAEDLAMEYLGFDADGETTVVGSTARQAVGFPAWALVHDPANGRHALAMVKEMEKLARLARSKPGNAKEGYDAIAARLGRSAPHFLPTFWEQAGRAFSAADNPAQAATCFNKARDAERVYALAIEEDRLADVHLEFALAGALPAKALTQYSRDLAARLPVEAALSRTMLLSTQRVAGGLPPHAGLVEDIARLAKQAGSDALAAVLPDLLATPAVAKANAGFWKSCRKDLIRLARIDARIRDRLLVIVPDPPGWRSDLTETWIELLGDTGALDVLLGRSGEAQAVWLERMVERRTKTFQATRSAPLLAVVERMAPALRAAGRPVRVIGARGWRTDVDLLDVLLACQVPVDTASINRLHLVSWLADPGPGRRDLSALAASDSLREVMWQALREYLQTAAPAPTGGLPQGSEAHARTALGVPGLHQVAADRLHSAADSLAEVTVTQLGDLVEDIAPLCNGTGLSAAPQAAAAIAGADVASALRRTLRAGLISELGWSVLDEAISRFGATATVSFTPSWPYLIVSDGARAVVLAHERIVADAALRIPPQAARHWQSPRMLYVDGSLLVAYFEPGSFKAYWSHAPAEIFAVEASHRALHANVTSLPAPGGGVSTGGRVLHVGDKQYPAATPIVSDGVTFWRLDSDERAHPPLAGRSLWREYDPVTGTPGRVSLPRFFEDGGDGLDDRACVLLPLPSGRTTSSPLGEDGGLAGWRVSRTEAVLRGESIDGRGADFPDGAEPLALLDLPGAAEPVRITLRHRFNAVPIAQVLDPQTGAVASRFDVVHEVPPAAYWHFFAPRDPAGSAGLRRTSLADARALVRLGATAEGRVRALAKELVGPVRAVMPDISDPTLAAAVAAQAKAAHEAAVRLAAIGALAVTPQTPDAADAEPAVSEAALSQAALGLHGSGNVGYWFTRPAGRVADAGTLGEIHAVGAAMSGDDVDAAAFTATVDWPQLLGAEKALAVRAASGFVPVEQRHASRQLLRTLATTGLLDSAGSLRVLTLRQSAANRTESPAGITRTAASTLVRLRTMNFVYDPSAHPTSVMTVNVRALEHAPHARFGPIDGVTVADDHRPTPAMSGAQAHEFAALVAARGPVPWRPEAVDALVARTSMSRGEAALVLAGMPEVSGHDANPYPASVRALWGLSAAAARTARNSLRDLQPSQRVALLSAVIPPNPQDLWSLGPDVDAIAACWASLFGERSSLDDDVLSEAGRMVPGDAVEVVRGLANPDACAWLGPGEITRNRRLESVTAALPWLAYRLPAGDPARSALVAAYDRIMAALAHAEQPLDVGFGRKGMPPAPAVETVDVAYGDFARYTVKTRLLSGPGDPVLDLVVAYVGDIPLRRLYSTDLAAVIDTIRAAEPGDRRWLHDPRVSVPDLVGEAAEAHRLGVDAAAYYLQLLALPDPTDRNVRRWTGWSASTLSAAREHLVAGGLVVPGKRERAGRAVFLPGGWAALRSPNLPVEEWKLPMYGWADRPAPAPMMGIAELFRNAWQRVRSGEAPALQQLKEAR